MKNVRKPYHLVTEIKENSLATYDQKKFRIEESHDAKLLGKQIYVRPGSLVPMDGGELFLITDNDIIAEK